jgi:pimeloyl-ACP methyl ester carboxylesterase
MKTRTGIFLPAIGRRALSCFLLLCTMFAVLSGFAGAASPSDTLIVREALGFTLSQRTPYSVIPIYPIAPWVTGRRTDVPKEGESLGLPNGSEVVWQRIVSDSLGWFPEQPRGERFAAVIIDLKSTARMLLEAMGNDFACVNGTLRSGNPYMQVDQRESWAPSYDYSRIPVELRAGKNLLLFRYARGRLKVRLVPVPKPIAFNVKDITRPDAIVGNPLDAWGSIALMNATSAALKGYVLVSVPAGGTPDTTAVPNVPAMGMRKLAFKIRMPARTEKGSFPVRLTLLGKQGTRENVIDSAAITLRAVGADETRRETFISSIDGSVQYYAVNPPLPGFTGRPALFLSVHGADVEALNQAGSYSPKKWGYVVAPTNRRPYGFSWEDWGRMDALEVLEIAKKEFNIDDNRVYLTGHSMGGHGSWFLGATYPDKFAAIGPSAGWITFQSYRFADAKVESSAVKSMFRRTGNSSDLFALVDNYRHFGVYVIHGKEDDNVPVQQSYMMLERLKPIHNDLVFWEQPGAGHWWDNSPEPGSDCVDWKPLFDFFARHSRPGPERRFTVDFTTANPGISSRDGWLTIDAQEHPLQFSSAHLVLDTDFSRVRGTTSNVSRLAIDAKAFSPIAKGTSVVLDSQSVAFRLDSVSTEQIWFAKEDGKWRQIAPQPASVKNARRNGTFKESFRNRMVLVYGTEGSAEENSWAYNRARYDAEKLWYQGNASIDVLADTEFDPSKEPDRNVILYGNARTHRLWKTLLPNSPVVVDKGRVVLGEKTVKGSDICCIFTRPRPGSDVASIGVVSGTGIEGFTLSQLVMYLEPGVGLPDLTVFDSDILKKGDAAVMLTGFFGPDWSMNSGDFVTGQPGK